jgi:hypothetical protein
MSTITAAELLTLWQSEQLTIEKAIKLLIENQAKHETAIIALNVSWAKLRGDVDRLTVHTGMSPEEGKSKFETRPLDEN